MGNILFFIFYNLHLLDGCAHSKLTVSKTLGITVLIAGRVGAQNSGGGYSEEPYPAILQFCKPLLIANFTHGLTNERGKKKKMN